MCQQVWIREHALVASCRRTRWMSDQSRGVWVTAWRRRPWPRLSARRCRPPARRAVEQVTCALPARLLCHGLVTGHAGLGPTTTTRASIAVGNPNCTCAGAAARRIITILWR
jgi:hypothetical protein